MSAPSPGTPLSLELRGKTSALHREVERSMGLPQAISSLGHYQACLNRFYRFYRPFEAALRQFAEWPYWEIDLPARAHAPSLARDLESLKPFGSVPGTSENTPDTDLPSLPTFAYALGALYVIEGSTLGSQFILRHLADVLGDQIAGADTFFRGYGAETGAQWNRMRAALDRFGRERPQEAANVIEGAVRTFNAFGDWTKP